MKKANLFLVMILLAGVTFGFQVNLDPSHLDVVMKQGTTVRKALTLSNTGTEALQVRVYLNDWALDKNAKSFLPAGTTAYTLKNSVKIFPTSFNLNPNDSKGVVLSLTSQKGDPDGQYGVVFFEIQPSQKSKGSGVSIGGRLGTLIAKETEGKQVPQLVVATPSVKLKANKLTLSLFGTNPTALLIRPKVTLVLTNDKNDVLYKGALPSEWILLPKSDQPYSAVISLPKSISDKNVSALVTVDFGDDGLLMKECKVTIE